MTPDEAQAALVKGRELFGAGRWDDLYGTLQPVHEAHGLEGTDGGEGAFYLGEACLNLGRPADSVPYFEEAVSTANVDFSPWAQEELARAHAMLSGAAPAADGGPAATLAAADHAYAAQDVDTALSLYEQAYNGGAQGDDLARAALGIGRCKALRGELPDARWYAEYAMSNGSGQVAADAHALVQWIDEQQQQPEPPAGAPAQPHPGQQPAPHEDPRATPDPSAAPAAGDPAPAPAPQEPDAPYRPMTPSLDPSVEPAHQDAAGAGVKFSHTWEVPVDKPAGPIILKSLVAKVDGRVHTAEGTDVDMSALRSEKGPGWELEFPIEQWKDTVAEGWDIKLKSTVDFGAKTEASATAELTNGRWTFQVEFTLIAVENGEVTGLKATITGGGKVENWSVCNDPQLYMSGSLAVGGSFGLNTAWIAEQLGMRVAPAAAESATAAELGTGAGAVGAGEVIIGLGFAAIAVSELYAFYKGVNQIEALKHVQQDADNGVHAFAAGYATAWGASASGSGSWFDIGNREGTRSFEAELKSGIEQAERKNNYTFTEEDREQVRHDRKELVASKGTAMQAVAEAMFGKMVRTAVFSAFMQAFPDLGMSAEQNRRDALVNCGIPDGPVTSPDVRKGYEIAAQHNLVASYESLEPPEDF